MPELSYTPEKPRLKPEEKNFFVWHINYIQPGKEKEFEGIFKKWVALNKSLNWPDEYCLYVGDVGTEKPVYIGISSDKNAAEWYSNNAKWWEAAGEEGQARLNKGRGLLRKFEEKTGWFRPDLSYTPKE